MFQFSILALAFVATSAAFAQGGDPAHHAPSRPSAKQTFSVTGWSYNSYREAADDAKVQANIHAADFCLNGEAAQVSKFELVQTYPPFKDSCSYGNSSDNCDNDTLRLKFRASAEFQCL